MKKMQKKCAQCGELFEYVDIRNIPATCGKRMCDANQKYMARHMDPLTGRYPDPERIKKA